MVRLFIENREIELTETVQVAISKQFEDLSNPTSIINDWSKTVSIPFTQRNNVIFGDIYRPDRMIVASSSSTPKVGIYFNPLQKLNFRLEWNGAILMMGYAKMNEIKQVGGKGTYELTLFGELGKVFQEMKKITFDMSSPETNYIIDGSQYVNDTIDKQFIYNSWTSTGQQYAQLYPKYFYPSGSSTPVSHPAHRITDIIGFAPNNSFSEGFDHTTYQTGFNTSSTFTETLGDAFTEATGIEPSTAIPNGMLPREIGEYRSYLQLPFIYWNKLFQVFQEKAEEITGYQFELNEEWFNTANPYWYNLVYMLKPFDNKNSDDATNSYTIVPSTDFNWGDGTSHVDGTVSTTPKTATFTAMEPSVEAKPLVNGYGVNPMLLAMSPEYEIGADGVLPLTLVFNAYFYKNGHSKPRAHQGLSPSNGLVVEARFVNNQTDQQVSRTKVLLCHNNYTGSTSGYDQVIRLGEASRYDDYDSDPPNRYHDAYNVNIEYKLPANYATGGENVRLELSTNWLNSSSPIHSHGDVYRLPALLRLYINQPSTVLTVNITSAAHRSGAKFTLNDLWNNDFNIFDEILKYCKMYRISVSVDEYEKKIIFTPYTAYFENYTVQDWTNKVDKSKDFVITPVTLENKYVLFNYEDNKTKQGANYKDSFGVNYGDYRLITEYNFNSETKELFKKIKTSITNSDNVLSWTNLYDYHQIVYSVPSEIYVYNKDKDNKQVDIFGAFYFHNGITSFTSEEALRLRSVRISDDTSFQKTNNTYFYTQGADDTLSVQTYPALDIVRGVDMCLFNIPQQNFTFVNNYEGKNPIYKNFWETYIDERYNIQNKKITCYVLLKPTDYVNFKFNKFVKIDDQLYIINKIYDYDVTSTSPTKVDLISIQDPNAYRDNTFLTRIDSLELSVVNPSYLSGEAMENPSRLGSFSSVTDVTFANGSKTYTTNNVRYTIVGNEIYYQTLAKYVDSEDLDMSITLKNKHHSATFHCIRYAAYPYPWIIVTDMNGNELTTLQTGSQTYKLLWHGTETYGVANHPSVSLVRVPVGGGSPATVDGDWTESEVMIQEGDDKWFRTEYAVTLRTNLIAGQSLKITVTDKEGWHETRTYATA